jgi:KTSC domain-containing protein
MPSYTQEEVNELLRRQREELSKSLQAAKDKLKPKSDDRIEMIPLNSSLITAIGYSDKTGMMIIRFKDGGQAIYEVSRDRFIEMKNAGSPGKLWNLAYRSKG